MNLGLDHRGRMMTLTADGKLRLVISGGDNKGVTLTRKFIESEIVRLHEEIKNWSRYLETLDAAEEMVKQEKV